jgi:hypothetical protein
MRGILPNYSAFMKRNRKRESPIMCSAEKLRVLDCIADCPIPQPTKWQRIANQIDAALVTARADIVNVLWADHRAGELLAAVLA